MMNLKSKAIGAVCLLIAVLDCLGDAGRARAGGGGENMLLVVNPNDPASLQIANAYAALRDIPANNICFLPLDNDYNMNGEPVPQADVQQLLSAQNRQLHQDNSGTGEPDRLHRHDRRACELHDHGCVEHAGDHGELAQLRAGPADAVDQRLGIDLAKRLLRLRRWPDLGALRYDARHDCRRKQPGHPALRRLQRPLFRRQYRHPILHVGDDRLHRHQRQHRRPGHRQPAKRRRLGRDAARGHHLLRKQRRPLPLRVAPSRSGRQPKRSSPPAASPGSRKTALPEALRRIAATSSGAVCGAAGLTLPNGSTYVPGCWADNLTSYGCDFPDTGQTKATAFIAAGASGTTGSVIEPYVPNPPYSTSNTPPRFTNFSNTFLPLRLQQYCSSAATRPSA